MACLTHCVDRELWKAIDYLKEQVRVLKEQQEEDKRLTRRLLEQSTVLFTPDTIWSVLAAYDFFSVELLLKGKLIPPYTAKFESILKAAGVDSAQLPPRSPNMNAHVERFVRSAKEECLEHLILSSEDQLRYVLSEYLQYHHHERIHQGLNRISDPPHEDHHGEIICIERLAGQLKSYHRKAA